MDVDAMRRTVELADGRLLDAWIDDPGPGGKALVFHFGTPSSGMPFAAHLAAARERGLRWISWSRPGYGSSTRFEGRTVADVVDDTRDVLNQLGVDRAYVAGWSGGGPHALACGALIPDRVLGVATLASVAPYSGVEGLESLDFMAGMGKENIEEFGAALAGPRELAENLDRQWQAMRDVTGADIADSFGDLIDEVDRGSLTGEFADYLAADFREGMRESYVGWLDDDLAFVRPWGFPLDSFDPPVHIWQGAHDRMVPFSHGQWLGDHSDNACPHLLPEHGHISLIVDQFGTMLDEMLARR